MGSHQLIQCSSADSRQELMLWGKYVKQEKYKMVISIVQSLRCCQLVVKKVPEPDVAREWPCEFPLTWSQFNLIHLLSCLHRRLASKEWMKFLRLRYPTHLWINFYYVRQKSSYSTLEEGELILWLFCQRISSYPILKNSLLFWTLTGGMHQLWNMSKAPIQT